MRIVCPSCAAAYDVPETALAPGRATRCARCGTLWKPLGEVAEPPPAPMRPLPPSPPEPVALRASPKPQFRDRVTALIRRPMPWVALGWIASIVVLLALGWGAYAWRVQVMSVWPPSARAYQALGLTP